MQRDQAHRTNELLERIAIALEKNNKKETATTKDIPGFEGVLNDLDNLYQPNDPYNSDYVSTRKAILEQQDKDDDDTHNDYLSDLVKDMTQEQYAEFHRKESLSFAQDDAASMTNFIYSLEYEECLGAIKQAQAIIGTPTSDNPDPAGYGNKCCDDDCPCEKELASDFHKDPYTYEPNPNRDKGEPALIEYCDGIKNDSDHDIRSTAQYYEENLNCNDLGNPEAYNFRTKKDCIMDYVTNEFGSHGARYTDIIKFAYYLGAHNAPKYDTSCRGYYAMAFNTRFGGHLVQGGKNQLVKGINKEGKERYFALSEVDNFTDYYKRIA